MAEILTIKIEPRRYMGFSTREKLIEVIAEQSIADLVEMAYQTGQAIQKMILLGTKEHHGFTEDEWFLQRSLIAGRAEQLTEDNNAKYKASSHAGV